VGELQVKKPAQVSPPSMACRHLGSMNRCRAPSDDLLRAFTRLMRLRTRGGRRPDVKAFGPQDRDVGLALCRGFACRTRRIGIDGDVADAAAAAIARPNLLRQSWVLACAPVTSCHLRTQQGERNIEHPIKWSESSDSFSSSIGSSGVSRRLSWPILASTRTRNTVCYRTTVGSCDLSDMILFLWRCADNNAKALQEQRPYVAEGDRRRRLVN
jgi:hypothetical protein